MQLLPLIPSTFAYRFGSKLDDTQYIFDVRWNGRALTWFLDVFQDDETPIARGLALVLGAAIGSRITDPAWPNGRMFVSDLSNAGRDATFDDLGTRVQLYYMTAAELAGTT